MQLRERKKARQRAAILAVAVELSEGQGFAAIRVRDLIERLEISEATFFNYFANKARLLDAWLEAQFANAFAGVSGNPRALRSVLRERARELGAQAVAATGIGATAWDEGRVAAAALAAVERCDLVEALSAARADGDLRGDVPPRELAELVLCAVASAAVAVRGAPARAAGSQVVRALDVVLDGARKRHERVRLRAGSRTPGPPPA